MNICLRKLKNNENLTAKNVLDSNTLNDIFKQDDGFMFLKQVRSSPYYRQNKKRELFSMIKQLGVPTFFISLSASEIKNFELLKILYKLKYNKTISYKEIINLDMDTKTKLIKNDSVTCVRYIDNVFNNIFNLLKNEDGPFKENFVTDSFRRIEFQARGSVHVHALLYCNNAPIYDENDSESEQKLIEFIDKFITCEYDPKNPYMTFQRHFKVLI